MRKNTRMFVVLRRLLPALLFALPVFAQQTGTINGAVADGNGDPLPGVVITVESDALQGHRSAVSTDQGAFLVRLLPPGIYTLTATMPGLRTLKQEVRVSIGSATRPRLTMEPEGTSEVVVVVADRVSELDTTQVTSNFDSEFVEKLPRSRDLESIATLAPGVAGGQFGSGITIHGAASTENVFMLNGAFVNADGIRGAADNLFIEDDIQETQVITGNASAEFGFFAGGMVNSITKSGSNAFHGTFRTSLTNEDWTARDPLQLRSEVEKVDKINKEFTFTFNGPIRKDRLWFAVAGRKFDTENNDQLVQGTPLSDDQARALGLPTGQTAPNAASFIATTERQRYQLKLTGLIAEGHTLVASYLEEEVDAINNQGFSALSIAGVDPTSSFPSDLLSINYRGVITPSFTVDANFAKRTGELSFGVATDDRIAGTTVLHQDQNLAYSNQAFGGGVNNERNSENWNLKFSYFLNTSQLGTHDITFGGQSVTEIRREDNFQSPSGWQLRPRWTRWEGDTPIGIFEGDGTRGNSAWLVYFPVINLSQGSDFNTTAAFVNDVWTLNEHWYLNVGLRYDKNSTSAEDGQELSATSNLSPRFTVNYDLNGDGVHQFSAGYNVYTSKLNDGAQDGSTAGSPASFAWAYNGPQTESLADVFNWIDQNFEGGLAGVEAINLNSIVNDTLFSASYSPDTSYEALAIVPAEGGIDGQSVGEYTLGYKHKLGNRGYLKTDVIVREYGDFLTRFVNSETGQTSAGVDRTVLANSDEYERSYFGINLSGNYRFENSWSLGGNYAYAQAEGNVNTETTRSGAIATQRTTAYPEFNNFDRSNPSGLLSAYSEHTLRLWAAYELNTQIGDFSFNGLGSYFSGTPYGLSYAVPIRGRETAFGLPDPATLNYATPPQTVSYSITDPDAFNWDDFVSLDLGVNYSLTIANRYEFFIQCDINNLLNSDAQIAGISTVNAVRGAPAFNLYTETPVEGVHYERATNFGQASSGGSYQPPRTISIDVGLKF